MAKRKRTNHELQNITHKTKDWENRYNTYIYRQANLLEV
jgi:hypothetical protein